MTARKIATQILAVLTAFFIISGHVPCYAEEAERYKTLDSVFTTVQLADATVSELTSAMENGILTAEQLVNMYLDRIEKYDKPLNLNSIISINANAIEEAKEIDRRRANGENVGILGGIPFIVKDNIDVAGMATSAGSVLLANSVAPDDAHIIKKLKEAGAIVLAKSNMDEFAQSGAYTRSSLGGVCHNAYDVTRTPAGSSGGTAVAISANFATFAIGTDTGSSLRRPASFSNLYTIRPSMGLVSRDGILPVNSDRDTAGPICTNAKDLALLMDIIYGSDENDSYTLQADSLICNDGYASHISENGLKGKKIGYLTNSFGYSLDDTVPDSARLTDRLSENIRSMADGALKTLEDAGAELVDISELLPEHYLRSISSDTHYSTFEYDLNTYLGTLGDNAPYKSFYELIEGANAYNYEFNFSYELTETTEIADPRKTYEWKNVKNNCMHFRSTITDILIQNDIDAVIYVSQTDIFDKEITSQNNDNGASYINLFGPAAGLPEIMIPMGFCEVNVKNGITAPLPLGMSVFTGYANDEVLVEIAAAYEAVTDMRKIPPSTPVLDDENLTDCYYSTLNAYSTLDKSLYTEDSVNNLALAVSQAKSINPVGNAENLYRLTKNMQEAFESLKIYRQPEITTVTQTMSQSQPQTSPPPEDTKAQEVILPDANAGKVDDFPLFITVCVISCCIAIASIVLTVMTMLKSEK